MEKTGVFSIPSHYHTKANKLSPIKNNNNNNKNSGHSGIEPSSYTRHFLTMMRMFSVVVSRFIYRGVGKISWVEAEENY